MDDILSASVLERVSEIHDRFVAATPFPHAIIEEFFNEDFAHALVAEFPAFDPQYAVSEMGHVGRKATIATIAPLGTSYRRAHEFFRSDVFLAWISELTGIPNLLYDEENFGGGTHENLDGQDLLPHVDFNYHPRTGYHRRLNLIVYLNEGWKEEWGGSIKVHSNPRDMRHDQTKAYAPAFNRAILFETSERSWHSFDRIVLPPEEKQRSRKSLSIYLYTRERPDEQIYADHTTFYIPRPLPPEFVPGRVLTETDVSTLEGILGDRDRLLALHQNREAERGPATLELAKLRASLEEMRRFVRLPLMGYVRQTGPAEGWYADCWTTGRLAFGVEPARDVVGFTIFGSIHDRMPAGTSIAVTLNGKPLATAERRPDRSNSTASRACRATKPPVCNWHSRRP